MEEKDNGKEAAAKLTAEQKLRRKLEKEQQKQAAAARQAQRIGAQLTKLARNTDTRRKVLAGAFALDEAGFNAEWGEDFMRRFDRFLIRDDDRALFGLEHLSDNEKEACTEARKRGPLPRKRRSPNPRPKP